MEPTRDQHNKNLKNKDLDSNCRLRHGLNVHCLALIFHYLSNSDLITVAGMNNFYKDIINDRIIPKRTFSFLDRLHEIQNIIERHGNRIKNFNFIGGENKFRKFNQLIAKHFSIDQLNSVIIHISHHTSIENHVNINLTEPFRSVKRIWFSGSPAQERLQISALFSHNLCYLHLEEIKLHSSFDWRELVNVTRIELVRVNGFNRNNFIMFLQQRPKLEHFYQNGTIRNGMHNIGKALVKYCANQIHTLRDLTDYDRSQPDKFYNFLAGFSNLKVVGLSTRQVCASDLIYPIMCLNEKKTVEKLMITIRPLADHTVNCICQRGKLYLRPFNKLKTLHIDINIHDDELKEHRMKLLTMYSGEILPNVEKLRITGSAKKPYDIGFMKLPNLRQLIIHDCIERIRSSEVLALVVSLQTILDGRKKRQSDSNSNDIIKMDVREYQLAYFGRVRDVDRIIEFRARDDLEYNEEDA